MTKKPAASKPVAKPTSPSALPAGLTPDRVIVLCALTALDMVLEFNKDVDAKPTFRAVRGSLIGHYVDDLVNNGVVDWLMTNAGSVKNRQKYLTWVKRASLAPERLASRVAGVALLFSGVVTHKAQIVTWLRKLHPTFGPWKSALAKVVNAESYDPDDILTLLSMTARLRSRAEDKKVGAFASRVAQEHLRQDDADTLKADIEDPATDAEFDEPAATQTGGPPVSIETTSEPALPAPDPVTQDVTDRGQLLYALIQQLKQAGLIDAAANKAVEDFLTAATQYRDTKGGQPPDFVAKWLQSPLDLGPDYGAWFQNVYASMFGPLPAARVVSPPAVARPAPTPRSDAVPSAIVDSVVARAATALEVLGIRPSGPASAAGQSLSVDQIRAKYSTDAQQSEVIHDESPQQVVIAAAGSGKTHTVINKVAYMIDQRGIDPSSIAMMAFNKHAAVEIAKRLVPKIGQDRTERVDPSTTHSFCMQVMKEFGDAQREGLHYLCDPSDSDQGFSSSGGSTRYFDKKEKRWKFARAAAYISSQPTIMYNAYSTTMTAFDLKEPIVEYGTFAAFIRNMKNRGWGVYETMKHYKSQTDDMSVKFLVSAFIVYEMLKGLYQRDARLYPDMEDLASAFIDADPTTWPADAEKQYVVSLKAARVLSDDDGKTIRAINTRFDFDDVFTEFARSVVPMPYDSKADLAVKRQRVQGLRDQYRYFFVDEAQDLNAVQHAIYNVIAEGRAPGEGGISYIGDDAQAIFTFRGATPENYVLKAQADGFVQHGISTNYRSRAEIVSAADRLINVNTVQVHKETAAWKGNGGTIEAIAMPDYQSVAFDVAETISRGIASGSGYMTTTGTPKYAVMCRTRKELDQFEDELTLRDIAYIRKGGIPFWKKRDVAGVIALLQLAFDYKGTKKMTDDERSMALTEACAFVDVYGVTKSGPFKFNWHGVDPADPINSMQHAGKGNEQKAEALSAFSNGVKAVADAAPDVREMFLRILYIKGRAGVKVIDKIRKKMASEETADSNDAVGVETAAVEGGGDSTISGFSVFNTLLRYQNYHDLGDPADFMRSVTAAKDRATKLQDTKDDDGTKPAVVLSTIHLTKGLEYENVFTVMNQGTFPSAVRDGEEILADPERLKLYNDDLQQMKTEDDRRLAYVAATRAIENLRVYTTQVNHIGRPADPSQFITELGLVPNSKVVTNESLIDPFMKSLL